MADNVAITAGSGTTIATDECTIAATAVQVQRVKPCWGADGTANDPQVSAPLPTQATFETSQMSNVGTIVTPKFASISVSSSGDNTIVAAVTSKKLRVLAYVIVSDGTVAAKWRSSTTTDLTGAMSLLASSGVSTAYSPVGHFETAAGEALTLNLSAAIGARGHLTYLEI